MLVAVKAEMGLGNSVMTVLKIINCNTDDLSLSYNDSDLVQWKFLDLLL